MCVTERHIIVVFVKKKSIERTIILVLSVIRESNFLSVVIENQKQTKMEASNK